MADFGFLIRRPSPDYLNDRSMMLKEIQVALGFDAPEWKSLVRVFRKATFT